MAEPNTANICYKIFHLPVVSSANPVRRRAFLKLDKFLQKHLHKLETSAVHIGTQEDYFNFNEKHGLLKPNGMFKWGELGIWASNLLAYQNFLETDYEYLLLVEDDILVENNEKFLHLLKNYLSLLPKDCEIFSFYAPENQFHRFHQKGFPGDEPVVPAFQDWSMLCYVIHRKTALKILNDVSLNGFRDPIDHYIFRFPEKFKSYTVAPYAEKGCARIETESTFQNKQIPVQIHQNDEMYRHSEDKSLGKVLVYKSYGGLGDVFFAIPAIYKLKSVSERVDFAVAPRLVSFFGKHLDGINPVDETKVKTFESQYDNVYELGNYPTFTGKASSRIIQYTPNVKQHAIKHYIDAVASIHKGIRNDFERYPYFQQKRVPDRYFAVHPGAGFRYKIWPTDKYAELIERLFEIFPELRCKIIKGPEDPEIEPYFSKKWKHIDYVTGGIDEVSEVMSGALFHIGNDAGITHLAGAFNIPTVAIHGPTGPGSWGSFAEHKQLIWGKQGVCNVRCNYNVVTNCADRICLTSVSVNRVLEALYKVLGKAYPSLNTKMKANPLLEVEFGEKDCLLRLNRNEFLVDFGKDYMKNNLNLLLKDPDQVDFSDGDLRSVVSLFKEHQIILDVPVFD